MVEYTPPEAIFRDTVTVQSGTYELKEFMIKEEKELLIKIFVRSSVDDVINIFVADAEVIDSSERGWGFLKYAGYDDFSQKEAHDWHSQSNLDSGNYVLGVHVPPAEGWFASNDTITADVSLTPVENYGDWPPWK